MIFLPLNPFKVRFWTGGAWSLEDITPFVLSRVVGCLCSIYGVIPRYVVLCVRNFCTPKKHKLPPYFTVPQTAECSTGDGLRREMRGFSIFRAVTSCEREGCVSFKARGLVFFRQRRALRQRDRLTLHANRQSFFGVQTLTLYFSLRCRLGALISCLKDLDVPSNLGVFGDRVVLNFLEPWVGVLRAKQPGGMVVKFYDFRILDGWYLRRAL